MVDAAYRGVGVLAGLLAVGLGLAACTASPTARWGGTPDAAGGGTAPPAPPSPSATSAADGTDVSACRDGDCEIAVPGPVDVRLDRRFGVAKLSVTGIEADRVSFHAVATSGGFMNATVGVGGTAVLNRISIRVVAIDDGTAILDFSPAS